MKLSWLSPVGAVQWFLHCVITEIVKLYMDSLACSGWFSNVIHRLFYCLFIFPAKMYSILRTTFALLFSPQKLPPIEDPLLLLSAEGIAHNIRHRKVKCEEVVAAFIRRVTEVNGTLNCVVEERFQDALKEARIVDELLTAKPSTDYWKKNKPLLGVPVTVKESIAVKGLSNHAARTRTSGRRAHEDAEAVGLLRRAGAIPLLVSNTPDLCMNWETFNPYRGTTCNPYDSRRTPGGSSGGEAALLGAAGSVLGLGSDLAGSIRLPAHFCGLFAHKPSPGFVPVTGHMPTAVDPTWENYFCIGPMTRYAEDLPLALRAIIPERNKPDLLRLEQTVDVSKLKVFYFDDLGPDTSLTNPINDTVRKTLMKVIHHFKISYNSNVDKIILKEADDIMPLGLAHIAWIKNIENVYQKADDTPEEWNNVLMVILKNLISSKPASTFALAFAPFTYLFRTAPMKTRENIFLKRERILQQIQKCLGEDGVLLCPTYPREAPFHRSMSYMFLDVAYLFLFNIIGLPVTQVPIEMSPQGIPLGIQVVASRGQDRLCLAVAKALQEAFGGWKPPPANTS